MRSADKLQWPIPLFSVLLVTAFGALSGCTRPEPPVPANLQPGYLFSGKKCESVEGLTAHPVRIGQSLDLRLGRGSQCLKVQPGLNEPAYLLKLPHSDAAYYLTVRSDRARLMLIPRIELLGNRRHPLRMFSRTDMKSMGTDLSLTVFIKPYTRGNRYLLLYPDPDLTGKANERIHQGASMAFYGLFSVPYGTSSKTTSVDVEQGTLQIDVVKYSTPKVKRVSHPGRSY